MQTKVTYEFDINVYAIHRLRVNVKSLAAEARFIRQEERRTPTYQAGLRDHRTGRLREEARYTQLALSFVRGRPYVTVEMDGSKAIDVKRLTEKIGRATYANWVTQSKVGEWLGARP